MPYILAFFLCCMVYKALKNLVCFLRLKHLAKMYRQWIASGKPLEFTTYKSEIVRLLKGADVKDTFIPHLQNAGYGHLASMTVSVYDNFLATNAGIIENANIKLDEAIGEYRRRIFEAIYPVYWIDAIFLWPKNALLFFGMKADKIAFKLLSVILTGIWWALGLVLAVFQEQLNVVIINLLEILP